VSSFEAWFNSGAFVAELASDQLQAQLQHAEHTLHTAREQLAAAQARVVLIERQIAGTQIAVRLAEQESQAQIGEAQAALQAAWARLLQAIAALTCAPSCTARRTIFPATFAPMAARVDYRSC
jgi:uncharacterized protein YPO0396